jgi:AcrR family transcriptional regulator
MSHASFAVAFGGLDECLLEVFDGASERAAAAMARAYRAQGSWLESVRGALHELLSFLDQRPALARFLIVGSRGEDHVLRARRQVALASLARALELGCPPATAGSLPAPFGTDAVVAAVAAILHARLLEEPVRPLRDMSGALMGVIVLPYLDAAAARSELSRPAQLNAA